MGPWLPTLLVIVVTALALTALSHLSAGGGGKRVWMAAITICGCLAIATTVWQGRKAGDIVDLPPLSGSTMSQTTSVNRERNSPAAALTRQVEALEDRVRELEAGRQLRTI